MTGLGWAGTVTREFGLDRNYGRVARYTSPPGVPADGTSAEAFMFDVPLDMLPKPMPARLLVTLRTADGTPPLRAGETPSPAADQPAILGPITFEEVLPRRSAKLIYKYVVPARRAPVGLGARLKGVLGWAPADVPAAPATPAPFILHVPAAAYDLSGTAHPEAGTIEVTMALPVVALQP